MINPVSGGRFPESYFPDHGSRRFYETKAHLADHLKALASANNPSNAQVCKALSLSQELVNHSKVLSQPIQKQALDVQERITNSLSGFSENNPHIDSREMQSIIDHLRSI